MNNKLPQVVTTITALREAVAAARHAGSKIALVPTMGALHEGHLSLVRAAKAECSCAVVSIYVNPSQFGANEDLAKYPRALDADLALLATCRTDLVFVPADEEMYGPDHATWVEVQSVAQPLEGLFRPGHFRGVTTIVLKLLNQVQPDVAYFGQKDFQQACVVTRMVVDLNVPVAIRVCPTVREPDGLAMSSRNRYLSPAARKRAVVLWKSLQLAQEMVEQGERRTATILARMRAVVMTAEDAQVDYIALVDPDTLQPVEVVASRTLAALAVTIEHTRLIDNCLLGCVKE
jgi:pantoate--beta-alanine ligase